MAVCVEQAEFNSPTATLLPPCQIAEGATDSAISMNLLDVNSSPSQNHSPSNTDCDLYNNHSNPALPKDDNRAQFHSPSSVSNTSSLTAQQPPPWGNSFFPSVAETFQGNGFGCIADGDDNYGRVNIANTATGKMGILPDNQEARVPEGPLKLTVPEVDAISVDFWSRLSREQSLSQVFDDESIIRSMSNKPESERDLRWSPFPSSLSNAGTDERIHDGTGAAEAVKPPHKVFKSEQMLWKQPGLRILDADDDSDDEMQVDQDLVKLVSTPVKSQIPQKRLDPCRDATSRPPPKRPTGLPTVSSSLRTTKDHQMVNSTAFSATSALNTFLDLRGGKFKRVKEGRPSHVHEVMNDPIQGTPSEPERSAACTIRPTQRSNEASGRLGTVQVPATPIMAALRPEEVAFLPRSRLKCPTSVVVDTGLLRVRRSLVTCLEQQGKGSLTLIYRDLNPDSGGNPLLQHEMPDIILNPGTGLIFTSLQALNQKCLPGQGGPNKYSLVQTRILRLASDYDQLFVLIGVPSPNQGHLETIQRTMTAFTGFCASLSDQNSLNVCPIWATINTASRETDEQLQQTWTLICRHAFPISQSGGYLDPCLESISLIQDETLWEKFLSRAGLNPMAAQIVLGMLKRLEPQKGQVDSRWGLRMLVQMRPDERKDMFAGILGLRVAERLNRVLDTPQVRL
jgi:hypothetical protein